MNHKSLVFILLASGICYLTSISNTFAQEASWPMAGANPQRTSWNAEEVHGFLYPQWYRPIEPYINPKVQVIAADGKLFVATAKGLYAFLASDGSVAWIYSTELPLGNTPTYANGTVYVGSYDHTIHAVDAATGQKKPGWNPHIAQAGFETNPLIIGNTIYAGNRDGHMYALDLDTGNLKWKFPTGGPILFSAAASTDNSTIYFASNDAYAYAVNATSGQQIWKSNKLPGAGFHSWWPVVSGDYVILAGATHYRTEESYDGSYRGIGLGLEAFITSTELIELFPDYKILPFNTPIGPLGTEPGLWASGTPTVDARLFTEYLESKPQRRTVFVLNKSTGQEYTFDSDNDGKPEYAPYVWAGTHSGNRHPPVIGPDGVMYLMNMSGSDPWIARARVMGWKFGTQFLSLRGPDWLAVDEPVVLSAGGNTIHWSQIFDNTGGSLDIGTAGGPVWMWYGHYTGNPKSQMPGYNIRYYPPEGWGWQFGNINGVYGTHTITQSPPIPYQGKVFMIRLNAIMAFSPNQATTQSLPMLTQPSPHPVNLVRSKSELTTLLESEIGKIITAGHLRPGYHVTGIFNAATPSFLMGDFVSDYFHNPSDTFVTLIRALPYLSPALQNQVKTYLQQESVTYSPANITHIGWRDGASRETFTLPPEIESQRSAFGPRATNGSWGRIAHIYNWWTFPPYNIYAVWKYAQLVGSASTHFNSVRDKLEEPPPDDYLITKEHFLNAYIAGYWGYLELQKMAGETENSAYRNTLNHLLDLRTSHFTKDSHALDEDNYMKTFNVSRNFLYLTPELADYLQQHISSQVQSAVNEYQVIAPGWFVSKYDATYHEGTLNHLYDYHSLFQAKAQILNEPYEELVKYLDVPAFARGDLFYIDNLVAALEAPYAGSSPTPPPRKSGDANDDGFVDGIDYVIWLNHYSQSVSGPNVGDFDSSGQVDGVDYVIWLNHYGT